MGKVCVACGAVGTEPKKPVNESEDCPDCGGQETMREESAEESSE